MKTILGFRAPWALVTIAVWLGVMVAAYLWAIPIFGNLRTEDFHGVPDGYSKLGPVTVNNPPNLIFAIVVASVATALLVGMVMLVRRSSAGRQKSGG